MLKIGLTGNIGSGKTVVAMIFDILGVPVYHSDARAKAILDTQVVTNNITRAFGNSVADNKGKINREKLAEIVFSDEKQLTMLNSLIHPAVIDDFNIWIGEKDTSPYVIMESAILYDAGYDKLFDDIIVVTAPEVLKIARVMKRDHLSEVSILQRLHNQKPEAEITGKARFVIINDDQRLVIPQVLRIHEVIQSL